MGDREPMFVAVVVVVLVFTFVLMEIGVWIKVERAKMGR
jgi:hypothetical protein